MTTTVRLEGKLLVDIEAATPADRSLSARARRVPQKDLERREMRVAAAAFKGFIETHPEEQAWLAEWDGVELASPPGGGSEAR